MIDKIGSCVALNFELGQASLQINFSQFCDHDIMSNDYTWYIGESATHISNQVGIQPILTEKLTEFHCLQFYKLHFWQQNNHRWSYFRFIVRLHFVMFGVYFTFAKLTQYSEHWLTFQNCIYKYVCQLILFVCAFAKNYVLMRIN